MYQMIFFLSLIGFCLTTLGLTQTSLTDSTSGCQYVMPWTCNECNMKWTGDCVNNIPNGNGVLTIQHESEEIMMYNGNMKNGNFHGFGSYKDGMSELEGYFMNGNFFVLTTLFGCLTPLNWII